MSETKQSAKERAARFVAALRRACADRGQRAALRRGLSPATVMDAWPVIARLGGDIGQPGASVYVDIAALFASHPEESDARKFGETCRRIAQGGDKEIPDSFDRRFRRLLASDELADVTGQLRSWIRLAAGRGVPVNYESLFENLWNWRWQADEIRVKWARSFWQSGETLSPSTTASPKPATA